MIVMEVRWHPVRSPELSTIGPGSSVFDVAVEWLGLQPWAVHWLIKNPVWLKPRSQRYSGNGFTRSTPSMAFRHQPDTG